MHTNTYGFRLPTAISTLALLLGACTSLPDVKPFASATLALEESVEKSFSASAVAQEQMASLLEVPQSHPQRANLEERRAKYLSYAESIRTDGQHRAVLMRAMSDYSDALAAIVDASENAQGNVDALAESLMGLVSIFQASPLPAVVSGAADLGRLTLSEVIKMKASPDLRKGVEAADPVIQDAAKLLLEDLSELRSSVATKPEAAKAAIRLAGGDTYVQQLRHVVRLETRRADLLTKVNVVDAGTDIEAHADSVALLKVEEQLAVEREGIAPFESRRDVVLGNLARSEELFGSAREAVAAWAKAHADLTLAVREGRSVNLRRLVEVVSEVKDIIKRMEEDKEVKHAG